MICKCTWQYSGNRKPFESSCFVLQQQHYFDDPDGKIDLPQCLRVDSWRRPADFITDKVVYPHIFRSGAKSIVENIFLCSFILKYR